MATNLEIMPAPSTDGLHSHYVLRGGEQIARYDSVEKAEALVAFLLEIGKPTNCIE
jgi:hypothetical protein